MKKVVVVTGALGGIGKATVKVFLEAGYHVVALDKKEPEPEREDKGVSYLQLDITNRKKVEKTIEYIEEKIGEIYKLIHVSGIFLSKAITHLKPDEWMSIFDVNCNGTFYITQSVSKKMIERREGTIVIVSSNASKFPRKNMAAYAASKAATSMYAKCLALELSEFDIRCNIISPGSTETDMQKQLWGGSDTVPESIIMGDLEAYRLGIPLKKIAQPADIAEVIYFIASEKANHITMEEITVDGGATMGV
ncbi:SDR family NAD(P)-dependent oxidoreductase [Anaerocolumna xylanovorans]|uniref:2,3-dihydro-2,3-dihydroxybenzoate dehydrogenase n=1 Tax=Anaerocolumna xylanovorans DSM 12503 TaxID=1121345 RepID=A0A1M7YI43_9FIRM|nr:SDR family NAD(P)-dependent oxidoreductase [Anaerocolumna xylanovorans]SHO52305.1 2,3-dihydro-2,3-dihydroxybenzoate dehydrogenase [Anaerocolumna xylanovorans DSM 12503]